MLANLLAGRMERKGSFFAPQLFLRCPLEGNCLVRASLSSEQMSSWDLLLTLVTGCEIPQPSVWRENRAQRFQLRAGAAGARRVAAVPICLVVAEGPLCQQGVKLPGPVQGLQLAS